ncbi:hypothetical protein Tco_1415080 [Tanacetum coccineum]
MLVNVSIRYWWEEVNSTTDTTWRVMVFRLSSGTWKSLSINLPCRPIEVHGNQVAIDRFIYWHALDRISGSNLIISFDMISEEFREIRLPDNLALNLDMRYKLRTKAMSTSATGELIKSCSTAIEVFGKLDVLRVDSCLTPR